MARVSHSSHFCRYIRFINLEEKESKRMPKQLDVNLGFTADTSQAKKQIQELRQSLQDIAKLPGKASSLFDDTDIKNASQAALELQQHLNAAVNVNTGKLDLSRLSTSL